MDETIFTRMADDLIETIENQLDTLSDHLDYERKPGNILAIQCPDGAQIILHKQIAVQEVWLAAKEGGFNFTYQNNKWIDTRDNQGIIDKINDLLNQHCQVPIHLNI
jgi:CyaY protein